MYFECKFQDLITRLEDGIFIIEMSDQFQDLVYRKGDAFVVTFVESNTLENPNSRVYYPND